MVNRERLQQRSELRRLFKDSRGSAGSRALMSMMRELGHQIGRFKVRSLMKEAGLVSKQPGSHAYKTAKYERPDIPNLLARDFDVQQPDRVWCGDITYIWTGGCWHYLPWCSIFIDVGSSVGPCQINLMPTWLLKPWTWHINNEAVPAMSCFTVTRVASTPVVSSDNGCGATGSPRA